MLADLSLRICPWASPLSEWQTLGTEPTIPRSFGARYSSELRVVPRLAQAPEVWRVIRWVPADAALFYGLGDAAPAVWRFGRPWPATGRRPPHGWRQQQSDPGEDALLRHAEIRAIHIEANLVRIPSEG
jgi:hypothetical protein